MSPEQMIVFLKTTQSAAVKGKLSEESPEGWELHLGDQNFQDCMDALRRFITRPNPEGKRGPWINAIDIYEEVRKVRESRLKSVELTFPYSKFYPQAIEGESEGSFARREIEAKRAYIKALADGEPDPEPKQLPKRYEDPKQIMGNVFRSPKPGPRSLLTPGVKIEMTPRQKALLRARSDSETN